MDVEALLQLQSQTDEIHAKETLPPLPPQMVSTGTQTQTWNELTLQIISDVVYHQVIHMKKHEVPSSTQPNSQGSAPNCKHVNGMTWNDVADIIAGSHKILCQETGVKPIENVLQVTIDWPPSFTDYAKTMIEIHFPDKGGKPGGAGDTGKTGGHELVGFKGQTSVKGQTCILSSSKLAIDDKLDDHDIIGVKGKMLTSGCDHETDDHDTFSARSKLEPSEPEQTQNKTNAEQDTRVSNVNSQDGMILSVEASENAVYTSRDNSNLKLNIVENTSDVKEPETLNVRNSKRIGRHLCKYCTEVCGTLQQLEHHMQSHSDKPVKKQSGFVCNVCNKVFSSRWKLSKHEPTHAPGYNVHPCQHCDKICKTSRSLQRHQRVHEVPPQYSCNECGLSFRLQVKLKQHMSKAHNVVHKYQCGVCGIVYKNESTLKDHLIEHSGKEFLCDICGKKFRRPELLRFHSFRHKLKTKPKSFRCSMCTKVYATDAQLQVHIRLTHMKERNNACKICDKRFFYHYQMVAHEKAHQGIMQHTCKYCNKGFLKKASLVTHEMVHTGNKPYKCRTCRKGFATKAHVARHEKIHTTDVSKPELAFQCHVCNAKFRYKGQWKEHEKRHAGVKDHNCNFCSKGFVSGGDLLRHLRTHTGGKPHKCQHCAQAFSKRTELLAHEASHGTETVETVHQVARLGSLK